ncbi:hypothetical protein TARUN_9533 [Trichoderma arundinaceum]|uniref:Hsp70 family chaperone n=1 Tax=Trichoderma arundinaceum TaxID=490622 RepID=A0A395N9C7_TRIAR|nr:hypothetical protein TARUN_9533 [Trichoderma arundinaceum]
MARPSKKKTSQAKESPPLRDEEPTIVIGIDFGTTYSGVAWAASGLPNRINIITNWDAVKHHCSDKEKAPSAISYDGSGKITWGYSIPDKESAIEWFKLCLLDESDIPKAIRNSKRLQAARDSLRQSDRRVVDVISDYLKKLWKHTILTIKRSIGERLVNFSRFKVVATLPAIWPVYAQIRMNEAIEKAGILDARPAGDTTLAFLSEPEAAALATMKDIFRYNKANMEIGDHFVVCDAGGGTVDVITYTVIQLDPLRVEESVKGDGKLCGASFLDERFMDILRAKLDEMSPDAWQILENSGALSRIINVDWENGIKTQFRNTDQHWVIQMPVNGPKRTHDEFRFSDLKFDVKEAQPIFKPVMAEISQLVIDQIETVKKKYKKEPKCVILVGGFGRQPYLYTCIQVALERDIKLEGKTEVLQSPGAEPWTAICRGAVIRGLELSDNTTESTVFRAKDQTSWFLRVGETVPVDKSIEKGFYYDIEQPITKLHTALIYSISSTPSK